MADPTDLIALPMLFFAWSIMQAGKASSGVDPERRSNTAQYWGSRIAIVVGAIGCLATSKSGEPCKVGVLNHQRLDLQLRYRIADGCGIDPTEAAVEDFGPWQRVTVAPYEKLALSQADCGLLFQNLSSAHSSMILRWTRQVASTVGLWTGVITRVGRSQSFADLTQPGALAGERETKRNCITFQVRLDRKI